MTKTSLFIFILLLLASCGGGGSGGGSGAGPNIKAPAISMIDAAPVRENEIALEAPVPQAALNFDVNLDLSNFNGSQTNKIEAAADLIKEVISSEEFKNAVLNHRVNGKKTFIDNDGLTNAQIYKKILQGSEELRPGNNNTMDLELEVYRESTDTVGYTFPNVHRIWMNSKYLNANPAYKVTTNMMHEWLHKLGFKHAVGKTPTRKYSVPYAIGYLVADLARWI